MVDEADAAIDRVQGTHGVRQERLAARFQDQSIYTAVKLVKGIDRASRAPLSQRALDVKHRVAMRQRSALGCQPNDEALDVAPQAKQHAFACEIDRRDLQAVARADDDQCIGGEAVDGAMHRRAAAAGYALQLGNGEEASGLELAIDQQFLDTLIGELEQVDAIAPCRRLAPFGVNHFESALAPRHEGFLWGFLEPRLGRSLVAHNKHIVIYYKSAYRGHGRGRSAALAARADRHSSRRTRARR